MTVDVIYQGLALAKGAPARSEGSDLFVELDTPMPVGTQLDVVLPEGVKSGRVDSVVEGGGAGMRVAFGAQKARPRAAEPNAPMAEMKSAPTVQGGPPPPAPAAAAEKNDKSDEPDDGPDDGKKKRDRRTKPRKTVIGH